MKKLDRAILEAAVTLYSEKRKPITKDELYVRVYFSMKRQGLKPYSFETIARRLRELVALGYFYIVYREEGRGNLRWRRALLVPKVKLIQYRLGRG